MENTKAHALLPARNGAALSYHLLSAEDVAGLQRFNAGLSAATRGVFLPHAYDDATLRRYVARARAGQDRAYVLCAGGEVAGYFFLWEFDQGIPLLGLGLADAWQGQGLGEPLLRILIAEARTAGRAAVELTTVTTNARAFRLYQRVGFALVGEVENIAGDGRSVREYRMFLPLQPDTRPREREFRPPG